MDIDLSPYLPVAKALTRASLPALGDLLGGVVPPPFNLAVKPAFWAISHALGVDPTAPNAQEQVATVINADPEAATAKLQSVEDAHVELAREATKQMEIAAGDTANARKTMKDLADSHSVIAYGAAVFSGFIAVCVIILIFIGAVYPAVAASQYMLGWAETTKQLLALAAGFWLGSSSGSRRKDADLASMAKAPTINAQPGSKVSGGVIRG